METKRLRISIDDQLLWNIVEPQHQGGSFVAICDQIGLSVQAKDKETLKAAVLEAVDLLTKDLVENKDLLRFLVEHNINHHVQVEIVQETNHGFAIRLPSIEMDSSGSSMSN